MRRLGEEQRVIPRVRGKALPPDRRGFPGTKSARLASGPGLAGKTIQGGKRHRFGGAWKTLAQDAPRDERLREAAGSREQNECEENYGGTFHKHSGERSVATDAWRNNSCCGDTQDARV